MKQWTKLGLIASLLILICSCEQETNHNTVNFSVSEFNVLNNHVISGDTLVMEMDLSNGPYSPISLPAQGQFEFSFEIENKESTSQSLAYKIYYQNESYKHPEVIDGDYNKQCAENFYGSWIGDSLIQFKEVVIPAGQKILVEDAFHISGNPLNLERFFGANPMDNLFTPKQVEDMILGIKNSEEWYNAVAEKAKSNNVPIETQIRADAIWNLEYRDLGIYKNQRWQNNPRVGAYSFMLVIAPSNVISELPDFVQDMSLLYENESRMNPFYYFKEGLSEEQSKNIQLLVGNKTLKTFAVLRPQPGLMYNMFHYENTIERDETKCSTSPQVFEKAHFMQYLNTEVRDSSLHNIDVLADIGGMNYSKSSFDFNQKSAARNIPSYVEKPKSPCVNSYYNVDDDCLIIENPGNNTRPYRKENAGVEGRFGFTYGKYTARIKFPEVLSTEGVWNGITCAFWLKFQRSGKWNNRNSCEGSGYLQSGYSREDAIYTPESDYTEIDIEIVKTSRNWPPRSYENPDTVTTYDAGQDSNLMFTCTNWDLACDEPEDFHVGIQPIESKSAKYFAHRWTAWYKAVTIKTEHPAIETVGDVMLYQIDWNPDHITWRLGNPETGVMKEMGYMNETMTKIPNNQMVPVMSQEFHYGHWWPMTPYPQGDIPYPANPIQGALYEIVIE